MFNISSNQWTWLSGNNAVDVPGVYGAIGIASISNYPGGRNSHSMSFDSTRNSIYVFGGNRYYDPSGSELIVLKISTYNP